MFNTFEELEAACMQCHRCRLSADRTNLVFGMGNPKADILFVGEGPGQQEDLQGKPFVGPSGKLLDKMLAAIDLDRNENVYIGNMVKCRPPQNRDPRPDEQELCLPWLRSQVRFIRPKIIVCLGRIAAQRLMDPNFRVTREHGRFVERKGIWMMGTFHPAALLRNAENKPAAFEDFLALRDKALEIGCSGVERMEEDMREHPELPV